MFIIGSRPRMQEHKGKDNVDRRNYWHAEQELHAPRERRRPEETPPVQTLEDLEIEYERWDGLS